MATDLSTMGPLPPEPHQRETRDDALRVAARAATLRRIQILRLLESRGGMCIFEITAALSEIEGKPISDNKISGRFYAMEDAGLIMKPGVQRLTPSGCRAEVYQITPPSATNPLRTPFKPKSKMPRETKEHPA